MYLGGAMHSPLLASEAFCSSFELLEPGHHLLPHLVELRVAGHLHLKVLLLPVATEHSNSIFANYAILKTEAKALMTRFFCRLTNFSSIQINDKWMSKTNGKPVDIFL